jgi:Cation efflux family
VNLGLSAAKISAGAVGHSFALVADGLESAADVLSGLVVFFGLKIAIKPPDRDHPYGHGKAEPIAALCVGLSLVAAAVTIMVESIHEILTPHRLPAPYTLVVLAGVLIVKGLLFRHVGSVRRLDRKPGGARSCGARRGALRQGYNTGQMNRYALQSFKREGLPRTPHVKAGFPSAAVIRQQSASVLMELQLFWSFAQVHIQRKPSHSQWTKSFPTDAYNLDDVSFRIQNSTQLHLLSNEIAG